MSDMVSRRRPNILLVMFDQLAPQSLPSYGHPLVQTPNIDRLATEGVVFENAYCNSPLCAPARFSLLSGQLASRIGAFDNAAEFPASIPTFAHYLRAVGYRTCLAGKMHFVGPDQLHGFEERVTTDVYPADFGWTPEWDRPEKIQWWFHNMLSVVEAGPYDRSLEMDYDEEVAFQAARWVFDAARDGDERPWLLTASFIHPHDPFLAPREYWARYDPARIDMPAVPFIPIEKRDPLSRRMFELYDRSEHHVTAEHVRAARHGYYAMITYADALLGQMLSALRATGAAQETVVIATADHGEMLGERGLWYKMTFFERSARVPLILHAPKRFRPRRVAENVSLVDLLPTLAGLAEIEQEPVVPIDGRSILPLAAGDGRDWPDTVYAEYMAEGTTEPVFMIRRGSHKYIACASDPPQLFDLSRDPRELDNFAEAPEFLTLSAAFAEEAARRWDGAALKRAILDSQRQRVFVQQALLTGRIHSWDFEPRQDAARRYNRNYGGELYDTDRRARLPFRAEPPKDGVEG
ncbi:MAG: choline-sulfatase [Rhodospirillales bacterium]|nr:choline-sulfatase [Rhodospirillales bacterium]